MRRLVALLVAVNVVFLGYKLTERWFAPTEPPALARVDPGAGSIAMIAETDPGELRERAFGDLGDTQRFAALPPREIATLEPDSAVASEDEALAGTAAPAQLDSLRPHVAATVTDTVAELLVDAMRGVPASPGQPVRYCYSVGPLDTPEEIAAVRAWLDARGGAANLREDERRELALYWVFFPPFATREEAAARVERMRGQGVSDLYIIPRGDMGNAISLGVYSRRASLDRRLSQIRSKGYEPEVAPRYKTRKAAWFDVEFPEDIDFQESGFGEAFPAVEMSPGRCPVAPTGSAAPENDADETRQDSAADAAPDTEVPAASPAPATLERAERPAESGAVSASGTKPPPAPGEPRTIPATAKVGSTPAAPKFDLAPSTSFPTKRLPAAEIPPASSPVQAVPEASTDEPPPRRRFFFSGPARELPGAAAGE